ncbi:sensor histidine kinase [Streptomyces sp. NPDC051555]|uniref:sensor histidine kinase n=1 Tax=Streptomyces sp. NPDC051555 TaxID=3365657 RepID=UPI0037AA8F9F
MSRLTGWWKDRGSAAKVELYTRGSFHFFAATEALSIGLFPVMSAEHGGRLGVLVLLLVCAHAALCGLLTSRALDRVVGRRERPARLTLATSLVTGATAVVPLALMTDPALLDLKVGTTVVVGTVGFGTAAVTMALESARRARYAPPAAALATALAALALGHSAGLALGLLVGVLLSGPLLYFTHAFSTWLLATVWELDRARELQARLAVAEERLRFGRDLHDVMGRNLAVIALKSELAVQLARRGRAEAVDQMVEVQRIARESQREVRDVVRGYREADLAVELEGARGVLSAAGIDCRVELSEPPELPVAVQSALGWVVREATTNVLRHGDARGCLIRLAGGDAGAVVLVVENDGAPPEPAGAGRERGSGLAGLRERLAALGGSLEAGTVPAAGAAGPAGPATASGVFRLRAEVPGQRLRAENAHEEART